MDSLSKAALLGLLALVPPLAGCGPKIGSHCVLNSDCGSTGSLVCDSSQPGGYCTQFNCMPNSCQNSAVCVELQPSTPGCPYDDYHSPSRTGRTFCLEHCNKDSDCRQSEGYVCRDPADPAEGPWNAAIIDDNQSQRVCIVPPDSTANMSQADAAAFHLPSGSVCAPSGPYVPPIDAMASFPGPDASIADGPLSDAVLDADASSEEDAPLESAAEMMDSASEGEASEDDGAAEAGGDARGDAPAAADAAGD